MYLSISFLSSYMQSLKQYGYFGWGFPGGSVVKNPPALAGDARDMGLISGLGTSAGVGNGYAYPCFCLGNRMDRGAWWATVHGVAKCQTRQKQLSMRTRSPRLAWGWVCFQMQGKAPWWIRRKVSELTQIEFWFLNLLVKLFDLFWGLFINPNWVLQSLIKLFTIIKNGNICKSPIIPA